MSQGQGLQSDEAFEPSEETDSRVPKTGKWIIWIIHKRNHEIATVALSGAYVAGPPLSIYIYMVLCPMSPLFLQY